MITEKQFLEALEIVKAYQKQVNELAAIAQKSANKTWSELKMKPTLRNGIYNHLKWHLNEKEQITGDELYNRIREMTIKELAEILTLDNLYKFRNVGQKTIWELNDMFKEHGVSIKGFD